jgi:hypothetical protein
MNSPLARCRKAGSCVAGLLIGLSVVIAVFAVMEEDSSDWLTILLFGALVFGAPIIFALGQSTNLRSEPAPTSRKRRPRHDWLKAEVGGPTGRKPVSRSMSVPNLEH